MAINWDYLAGFTDGEGYIGVVGRGPRVTWGQKDKHQLEVLKDFLEAEGFHPTFYHRKAGARSPNGVYVMILGRREEVARVIQNLKPRMILKKSACNFVQKWMEDNPPRANMSPVDMAEFLALYNQGYTQIEIARRMKRGTSKISDFAKENGFKFIGGGRVVDGKRVPAMTEEEYKRHRAKLARTATCPDCGSPMYYTSKRCRACTDKSHPKTGRKSLMIVSCDRCGKDVEKIKSQLETYPVTYCKDCKKYRGTLKSGQWSKIYDCCTDCKTTDSPHVAKGKCQRCHAKWYRQTHQNNRPIKSL